MWTRPNKKTSRYFIYDSQILSGRTVVNGLLYCLASETVVPINSFCDYALEVLLKENQDEFPSRWGIKVNVLEQGAIHLWNWTPYLRLFVPSHFTDSVKHQRQARPSYHENLPSEAPIFSLKNNNDLRLQHLPCTGLKRWSVLYFLYFHKLVDWRCPP